MNENDEEFSRDSDPQSDGTPEEGRLANEAGVFVHKTSKHDDYDNPIGLTQAFAPVSFSGSGETGDVWGRGWSNENHGESDGWDQIVPDDDTPDDWREPDDGEFSQEDEDARRRARKRREHHTIVEYDDLPESDYERAAASSKFNEDAAAALAAEKSAREQGADAYAAAKAAAVAGGTAQEGAGRVEYETPSEDFPDAVDSLEPADKPPVIFEEPKKGKVRGKAGRGKHASGMKELSVHERKSRKTRKTLLVIIALLVVVLCALGYFVFHLVSTSQTVAEQQTQASSSSSRSLDTDTSKDANTITAKKTDVPDLAAVLGKTQDEAVSALGHGAQVRDSRDVNDEGSAIKKSVTVALTDEPADSKTGTPSVYLGLDEEGHVVQAGYSTSTSALGYGAFSFVDMVQNNHVIERTLQDANVMVNEGAAVLPSDKSQYSTYASDGTTLTRERYSFSGDVTVNGTPCTWSAVLSYDYANANLTGNLADTVRVIYIYVTKA